MGKSEKKNYLKVLMGPKPVENPLNAMSSRSSWEILDTCVLHGKNRKPITKQQVKGSNNDSLEKPLISVLAFDLDQTIVTTKSGLKFTKNFGDFRVTKHLEPAVKQFIENNKNQVIAVIFTNQAGVISDLRAKSFNIFRGKAEGALNAMPVPALLYGAARHKTLGKDTKYRKPLPGMFDLLTARLNEFEICKEHSLYVGDAAGRPGDHSADDLNFAKNAGVPFNTPEEFFNVDDPFM